MQIKPCTGKSQVILMILVLFPHILKNVIFRHEFVHEFMREFVDEFFTNFVHEFKYEIRTNWYEFFCTKNWLCYEWSVLYLVSELNNTCTNLCTFLGHPVEGRF